MKKITFCFFFTLGTLPNFIMPQQISFSGYGAAGYRFINQIKIIEYNQETYFKAKFQADIEINEKIDAQIDFRGNSEDQRVELREFSARFSYLDKMQFKFGNIKKPFGSEQIENSENLYTIERSYLAESVAALGYGGRSIGLTAYYKYSKKEPGFPHSYYLNAFKDNAEQTGFTGRYIFHFDDFAAAGNYCMLKTSGNFPILSHAFSAALTYDIKDFVTETELFYVQDPIEGIRRIAAGIPDTKVYSLGARLLAAVGFDTDGEVIEEIEPLIHLTYFQPDTKISDAHTFQVLFGTNFYFDKNVRLRLNFDGLLTKNQYSDDYSTHDSRFTIEMQVRF
ncbi:MAG: porin [Ignavibacteria bacterium]